MESIFGRINRPYEELKELFASWQQEADQFLVYEHTPDDGCKNLHCHILALNITSRKKLYDRQIWKALNLSGSANFGFDKYKPGLNTVAYMSKGIFDPKINKSFDLDFIIEQKKIGYIKDDKKNKESKKVKKETYWDVIEAVRSKANVHNVLRKDEFGHVISVPSYSFDNVYTLLMAELEIKKIRSSEFDLNRWLTTILRQDFCAGRNIREKLKKNYFPDV